MVTEKQVLNLREWIYSVSGSVGKLTNAKKEALRDPYTLGQDKVRVLGGSQENMSPSSLKKNSFKMTGW